MPRKDSHAMGEPLVTLSGRLPLSVLARIDAYVESMRLATPGLNIGRSDAFRILLVEGLDAVSRPTTGAVTDTVTDTTVSDPAQLRLMLDQELRAVFAHAAEVLDAIRKAEHGTGTGTDTETVTDTVTDTDAPQSPARRRKRQPAPAD